MMYNITLKATNPDGVATTDPVEVIFPATGNYIICINAELLFNCKN